MRCRAEGQAAPPAGTAAAFRRARRGAAACGRPARGPAALALALALALGLAAPASGRAAPPPREPLVRLTRSDAWYALGTAVAVGGAGLADDWARARATAWDDAGARRLARGVRALGAPEVLGPAVVLGYLGGRALDRPGLRGGSARVAASLAVAGVAATTLKVGIGRVRPEDRALESDPFQPLSGHASLPSGHTTLAFAAATALDGETKSRWVWVGYPLAALVGWSRMRDDRHWGSDVVAGAALGIWTARKTGHALRLRATRATSARAGVAP